MRLCFCCLDLAVKKMEPLSVRNLMDLEKDLIAWKEDLLELENGNQNLNWDPEEDRTMALTDELPLVRDTDLWGNILETLED